MKKREESSVLLLVFKASKSVAPGKIDRRSKYRAQRRERGRRRRRGLDMGWVLSREQQADRWISRDFAVVIDTRGAEASAHEFTRG